MFTNTLGLNYWLSAGLEALWEEGLIAPLTADFILLHCYLVSALFTLLASVFVIEFSLVRE